MNVRRWFPASGIVFVVLAVVAVVGLGGNTPDPNSSADKVSAFYDAHHGRQIVAAFILAAAAPFAVLFAVSLAAAYWPEDAGDSWNRVAIGGGVLVAAASLLAAFVHFVLADSADKGVTGDALRVLNVLDGDFWVVFNGALGVLMLGAAGVVLSRAGSPRWLGWAAAVLAVALFIPFADFFALLVSLIWIVVQSVLLLRRREGPTRAAVATPR